MVLIFLKSLSDSAELCSDDKSVDRSAAFAGIFAGDGVLTLILRNLDGEARALSSEDEGDESNDGPSEGELEANVAPSEIGLCGSSMFCFFSLHELVVFSLPEFIWVVSFVFLEEYFCLAISFSVSLSLDDDEDNEEEEEKCCKVCCVRLLYRSEQFIALFKLGGDCFDAILL